MWCQWWKHLDGAGVCVLIVQTEEWLLEKLQADLNAVQTFLDVCSGWHYWESQCILNHVCLFFLKKQLNTIFTRHTGFRPGLANNEWIVSYTDVKNEVWKSREMWCDYFLWRTFPELYLTNAIRVPPPSWWRQNRNPPNILNVPKEASPPLMRPTSTSRHFGKHSKVGYKHHSFSSI